CDVIRAKPCEELFGAAAKQRQVAVHAPRNVQHDDQADGLGRIVEESDRLRLPFVTHLEGITCKVRGEPAISIRHGDEDTDGLTRAAEDRLLPPGRTERAKGTGRKRPEPEKRNHAHSSFFGRPGKHLQSYHELSDACSWNGGRLLRQVGAQRAWRRASACAESETRAPDLTTIGVNSW